MYQVATRSFAAWGVDGYEVPRNYHDYQKIIKEREYEEMRKKGKATDKPKIHVTKRGNFLDDEIKMKNKSTGPGSYNIIKNWSGKDDKDKKPVPKATKKMTYIDQIFHDADRNKFPGPGAHNVIKTDQETKKEVEELKKMREKLKYGDKPNFLQEYQFLGNEIPGPGNFNPRPILPKINQNNIYAKNKPQFWIDKHKEPRKTKEIPVPPVGQYTPLSTDYITFQKIEKEQKEHAKEKPKVNYLGLEQRFKDMKKSKSSQVLSILNAPGPGAQQLIAKWPGKVAKKDEKPEKNWMNLITKGTQKSIYY